MNDPSRAELKYLVERQREELKTLNEVGRLLGTTIRPRELTQLVLSYLMRSFPVALCGLSLFDHRYFVVRLAAQVAQVEFDGAVRQIRAEAERLAGRPLQDVAATIEDQTAEGGQWGQQIAALRSHCSVPLTANDRPVGVLSLFSGKDNAFSEEDRRVLAIVADQLAASLQNAFLLEELSRAGQLKNDLLMVISHELRIPLTSIKEGVDLVTDGTLGAVNEEQRDFLKTVNDNVDRLSRLVEKVLLATEAVTGQLHCQPAAVDLQASLPGWLETYRERVAARGTELACQPASGPLSALVDQRLFCKALDFVLENAIQASGSGGHISVRAVGEATSVAVQIQDDGVGISDEDLRRVFEQFHLVGGVDDRKTGGLGLGLFLTKAILEAHHGDVAIHSAPAKGTVVTLRLPRP